MEANNSLTTSKQTLNYKSTTTKLKGEITIPLKKKIDALAALAAAEQSGMEWGNIQTRQDSLDDVFIKLVSEPLGEQGETQHRKKAVKSGGAKNGQCKTYLCRL